MDDKVVSFIQKNDMKLYKKIISNKNVDKNKKKLEKILISKFDKETKSKIKKLKLQIKKQKKVFKRTKWNVTPSYCTIRQDPIKIKENSLFKDWLVKGDLCLNEDTGYFSVPSGVDDTTRIYSEEFLKRYNTELVNYRKLINELDNLMTAFFNLKDSCTDFEEVVCTANYLGYKNRVKK